MKFKNIRVYNFENAIKILNKIEGADCFRQEVIRSKLICFNELNDQKNLLSSATYSVEIMFPTIAFAVLNTLSSGFLQIFLTKTSATLCKILPTSNAFNLLEKFSFSLKP